VDEAALTGAKSSTSAATNGQAQNLLVDSYKPEALIKQLAFSLPEKEGRGRGGLLDTIQNILKYSVNTWDQGFLDKLYSSTNAVSQVTV
jgi:glutamate decarboxylase